MKFTNNGRCVLDDKDRKFRLITVGDCIPGGRTEYYYKTGNLDFLLGEASSIFNNADFTLFNLETPLCRNGSPIPKCGENFRVDPETANGFKRAGFNIAALANNHILDYGKEGLEETLNALDVAGIKRHGAGKTSVEAAKPLRLEANGVKIAFLNFAEGEFSSNKTNQWGAAPIDLHLNQPAIERAEAENDIVIVSAHAGNEYQHFPSPWIQNLYRKYIDFGANLVVGHHPHIPQGLECYQMGIIIYSLGDFMYHYLEDPGTCVTFALDIRFNQNGINSIDIHPMQKKEDTKMSLLKKTQRDVFIKHINRISVPLKNPQELELLWQQGVIRRFENFYLNKLTSNVNLVKSRTRQTEFAAGFLYNMFDCPSHRQSLKKAFKLMHHGEFQKDKTTQEYLTCLYRTLEALSRNDTLEPYRKTESIPKKIVRNLKKGFRW